MLDCETHELLSAKLKILQPKNSDCLRVNLDTMLLAYFTQRDNLKKGEQILELCTGHGAISLILSHKGHKLSACDIEPELIEIAKQNALLNKLDISFFASDVRDYKKWGECEAYDRIVVNPPYFEPNMVRCSENSARAVANNGLAMSLSQLLDAAKFLLCNHGKFDIIIKASRLSELLTLLENLHMPAKLVRFVHAKPSKQAYICFVSAMKGAKSGVKILPPFFVKDEAGNDTLELGEAYK